MIRRPPRSTQSRSSAASDVYKRQGHNRPPVGVAADQKGKTVHVKEYTKNDGTTVAAHDRKAPEQHATATKAEKPKKASTVSQPAAFARNERGRIQPAMPPGTPSRDRPAIQTAAQGGSSITSSRSPAAGSADAPSHMQ